MITVGTRGKLRSGEAAEVVWVSPDGKVVVVAWRGADGWQIVVLDAQGHALLRGISPYDFLPEAEWQQVEAWAYEEAQTARMAAAAWRDALRRTG
jgi:hypothetical protein